MPCWKSADHQSQVQDHTLSIFTAIHPGAGLVITAMYYVFSKLSLKRDETHFRSWPAKKTDAIPLLLIPLVMIGTWLTHLFGVLAEEGCSSDRSNLSHALRKKIKLPRGMEE